MANKSGTNNKARRVARDLIKAFDLEKPELPPGLSESALTSGDYPYDERMEKKAYEKQLLALQLEMLKLQVWCREKGERIVVLFEGRDAAGKGGTIKRLTEHLNPRHAHIVALSKPTETERGQWYFQRYVEHLPTAGDMTLFDRSWYNRAGVERVMKFANESQIKLFLREAPKFEQLLVNDGIRLFKFWLTISQETQLVRFHARKHDPLKFWKLSPIDIASLDKWDAYTEAKIDMFKHTHKKATPWTIIRANDKRRARINVMQALAHAIPYKGRDLKKVGALDKKIVDSGRKFMFGGD